MNKLICLMIGAFTCIVHAYSQGNKNNLQINKSYGSLEELPSLKLSSNKIKVENEQIIFYNKDSGHEIKKIVIPKFEFSSEELLKFDDPLRSGPIEKETYGIDISENERFVIITDAKTLFNTKDDVTDKIILEKKIYDSKGNLILLLKDCKVGIVFSPSNNIFLVKGISGYCDTIWFYNNEGKLLKKYLISDNFHAEFSRDGNQIKGWDNVLGKMSVFDCNGKSFFEYNYGKIFKASLIHYFYDKKYSGDLFLNMFSKKLVCADTTGIIKWEIENIIADGGYINNDKNLLIINSRNIIEKRIDVKIIDILTGQIIRELPGERIIFGNNYLLNTEKGGIFNEYKF